ncbi:MAG: hypothetical protein AB7H77_07505 [Bdellovibrionales bacterium]
MNKRSEEVSIASVSNADVKTARVTPYIKADKVNRFHAIGQITAAESGKYTQVRFLQATDSSGTGAKLAGTATQTVDAREVQADLYADDLDSANGFIWVAAEVITNNSSATPGSATLMGDQRRYN